MEYTRIENYYRYEINRDGDLRYFEDKKKVKLTYSRYVMVTLRDDNKKGKTWSLHKLMSYVFFNEKPQTKEEYLANPNSVINYIDGDTYNNNILNLELVSQRQNISKCYRKDRLSKSSIYNGVSRHRNKWKATSSLNNKRIHLGLFDNPEEANEIVLKFLKNNNI